MMSIYAYLFGLASNRKLSTGNPIGMLGENQRRHMSFMNDRLPNEIQNFTKRISKKTGNILRRLLLVIDSKMKLLATNCKIRNLSIQT